jgi:hypothetical protein
VPSAWRQYLRRWVHLRQLGHRRVWGVYLRPAVRSPGLEWKLWFAAVWSFVLAGCGAKDVGTTLPRGDVLLTFDSGLRECRRNVDCAGEDLCFPRACDEGKCVDVEPIRCDDGDPCTVDECKPRSGECSYEALTPDNDGDGFRQPLPGFAPGAPGACGVDGVDQASDSPPGGLETCDGVDNDCNGVTDDGYLFRRTGRDPVLVAAASKGAESGGLVYAGEQWVFFVTMHDAKYDAQLVGLDARGVDSFRAPISLINSDTFAGSIQWSGQVLATVWEDRRDSDYEIYFNRFDPRGNKVAADLRISNAAGFSLDPVLLFTGVDYLVAWSDGRNGGQRFGVFGQRVDILGSPIGGNVHLTPDFEDAKSASLAAGVTEVGMTFSVSGSEGDQVAFRAFPYDASVLGPSVVVSQPKASPATVTFASDRYLMFWTEYDVGPGQYVWAAAVDGNGTSLLEPRAITRGGGFARSVSALSLGDRVLLAWANDWGDAYNIYVQMFSSDLQPLGEATQMTASPTDILAPRLRFGRDGEVALAYTERSVEQGPKVWFDTLTCR